VTPGVDYPRTQEAELIKSAAADLEALSLVDRVTQLLAGVIQRIDIRGGGGQDRLTALWFMAIIAFRAMRAAMHVLSAGYEEQAIGFERLIDELFKRAQKVREDESGEYARQWLEGHGPGTPTKLVGQGLYETLSGPVHAAARGVFDWIAISREDGSTAVVVGPERRPESANATLSYMAGEGRDIAGMLAAEAGFEIDLRDLDRQIHELHDRYLPDTDE
jgi:hypothetical protein